MINTESDAIDLLKSRGVSVRRYENDCLYHLMAHPEPHGDITLYKKACLLHEGPRGWTVTTGRPLIHNAQDETVCESLAAAVQTICEVLAV